MSDVEYSTTLVGYDDHWSNWNTTGKTSFKNLPYGSYIFKVKGNLNGKETLVLDVRQIGYDDYDEPSLTIFGYDGNTIKLEQNFDARGFSRENAIENAGMIMHEVIQKDDSILVFDSDLRFKENAIFRRLFLSFVLDLY